MYNFLPLKGDRRADINKFVLIEKIREVYKDSINNHKLLKNVYYVKHAHMHIYSYIIIMSHLALNINIV